MTDTQSRSLTDTALRPARFLNACRRVPTDTTPIWFMRQAGRYMPEYRALREKYTMLESLRAPELAVEITMQPIQAFDLDAAIIFADILTPLIGMGLALDFIKGEGPHIDNPIRSSADIERLITPPAAEALPFTLDAIRLASAELAPRGLPLIGFAGAPFTLASYAIEGGGSKNYERTKALMYGNPAAWHALMDKFATVIGEFLAAQARAGAAALQVFDSWVGALSPADYREYVLPYSRRVIEAAQQSSVPVIHFSTGTSGMLDLITGAGGDVIGVDWRIDLDVAWARIGDRAIQGNLDPLALFAPWDVLKAQIDHVLARANGRPGHIFNLGHGILPGTPIDAVRRVIGYVHEVTARL